ncbi:polymorphic toxin-type HINT domain-containing protein, partial [Fervidicella metallireducens]|uniref:polymorphic toxin-type HINT domain-containing protein n=1 Tax=Fervidicella metallireducens TaxID=655338 RepID=UPI001FA7F2AD
IKLRAGDKLLLRSGKIVIVEMVQHEMLERPVKVYNFEVKDWHTYYVSDSSVLVHNKCTRSEKYIAGKVTGYTRHGINQAISRNNVGVKPSAILNILRNPKKVTINVENGSIKLVGKEGVVVLNKAGKIITTWAKSSKYRR